MFYFTKKTELNICCIFDGFECPCYASTIYIQQHSRFGGGPIHIYVGVYLYLTVKMHK